MRMSFCQFEGTVIIHYHDGSRFKGSFHRGIRHGQAVEETPDGKRFEGSYKNGERDGNFVEKNKNGQIIARGHYSSGMRYSD